MKSLKGRLLVSVPQLMDPNFHNTVVLLVEHSKTDGAVGLIINRRTNLTFRQVVRDVIEKPVERDDPMYWGGPVDGPLMVVHTCMGASDDEVLPGVYCAVQKDLVNQVIDQTEGAVRFFLGHSGWGPGQLEREMKENAWLVAPALPELIFGPPENLWNQLYGQLTLSGISNALRVRRHPVDPSQN